MSGASCVGAYPVQRLVKLTASGFQDAKSDLGVSNHSHAPKLGGRWLPNENYFFQFWDSPIGNWASEPSPKVGPGGPKAKRESRREKDSGTCPATNALGEGLVKNAGYHAR